MLVKDVRAINGPVLRLMKDNAVVWDRYAESFKRDLTLWIPGISGVSDESASNHTPTTAFDLGNADHLAFTNAQYIDLPNDVGYTNQLTACSWFRSKAPPKMMW